MSTFWNLVTIFGILMKSTNMPGIGSLICEIAVEISEMCEIAVEISEMWESKQTFSQ